MALTIQQRNAINELAAEGLSPTGQALTQKQKDAINTLKTRNVDAATIFESQAPLPPQGPVTQSAIQQAQQQAITQQIQQEKQQPGDIADIPKRSFLANVGLGVVQGLGRFAQPLARITVDPLERKILGPALTARLGRAATIPPPSPGIGSVLGRGFGEALGIVPAFIGGEAAAGAGLGALGIREATPFLGRALPFLKGFGGGATVGLTQDPTQPGRAILTGGAIGAATPLFPATGRLLFGSKAAKNLTKTALDEISGGLHTGTKEAALEKNAQSAARNIRTLHTDLIKGYTHRIGSVMDDAGNININTSEYSKSIDDINKFGKISTKRAQIKFDENPNLENAHNLQSTLGSDIRAFKPANREEGDQKTLLTEGREALKNDITNSLNEIDPTANLSSRYTEASDYFRDNIVPFGENKTLKKIATGVITNPKSLSTIFARPEESILGILDKLPPSFRNKIVYDVVGRGQKIINPKRFVTAIDSLNEKGLKQHYLSDDLMDARDTIERSLGKQKGVLSRIIKGGLIRIPEWLIAGTALRLGAPFLERRNIGSL